MKLWIIISILLLSFSSFAKDSSQLVDVNKDSKLSDYFNKINKKVTADTEDILLKKEKEVSVDLEKEAGIEISEAEIPLNISKQKKKKKSGLSPVNKMMLAIFGLLVISGIVFAFMQKIGKRTGHSSVAKNINILAKKSLGPKKDLMLIRIAGETILLGVTEHNINHLKTLSLLDDELPSFTESKFSEKFKEKIEQTKITDEIEVTDGFAVSKLDEVKDMVTKRFSI